MVKEIIQGNVILKKSKKSTNTIKEKCVRFTKANY